MPARRAISAVVAPLKPASAKTDSAASRMRRSMLARLRWRMPPPWSGSTGIASLFAKAPDLHLQRTLIGPAAQAEAKKKLDRLVKNNLDQMVRILHNPSEPKPVTARRRAVET